MSHELHNLVTKIENACDPESYEVADTEHLVRLAVAEYVVAQNGLVASARVVDPTAVQKVIDRHIRENISAADPQTWFANVATKIADFLELAYEDRTNNESAEHVDLLPIGHPRNTKNLGLTASARMQAVAEWVAADPRITSDLGRQAVYNAYRAKPDSLEATYANAKVEALAASGVLPADFAYEAIVASFKKMSFAERSARSKALAKVRRRDRWKQFANEFGRLRGFFSKGDGTMFSATGKIAGSVPGENKYYVEYDGSDPEIPKGIYIQDAGMSENVRATLSSRVLKNAPNVRKSAAEFDKRDQASAVNLEDFLATKVDAPGDWTKNEDGSFSSNTGNKVKEVDSLPEGDYYFEGVGENNEQDLGEPLFEIRDSNDELIGVAQDWNGIQKIALTKDSMKEKAEKKAAEINDETFAEALAGLDDETNWDNLDTEPSYESPNGILSVSFNADADTDGEGGMKDASFWSATLDPEGEAIDLGTWGGDPDDDLGEIMDIIEANYKEYKAKKTGETAPAEPVAEAPAKPEVKQTEKSKPSYLDQKPKQYQSTLEKDSLGYSTGVDDAGFVEVRKNEDGGYDVNHGFNYMHDENSDEVQFDEGSKSFPTEKEALDFANEKLNYYNSWRVDEDAANKTVYDEPGLGQDVPEAEAEAPAKPVKPLSEKQMEPASPKQYALLKEFQEERDGIDENQNQAINDALEKQNLSKAQMASLFGDLQKKPFKPEIDPTKPSDRMINSLRDYLTNKELTPDEINSALDELEAGLDRAGVEKLLAKLRRRPDKAKDETLGQDIPSDLVLTPQGLANGFWFDKSKDGKTWSAENDEGLVEVTENNGKWVTTERSGGNGESGYTRESEKQHANAQEAFEYAAEVAGHSWDQDLYDDLNNDFGDDEDEIGFAEEEGLGQATTPIHPYFGENGTVFSPNMFPVSSLLSRPTTGSKQEDYNRDEDELQNLMDELFVAGKDQDFEKISNIAGAIEAFSSDYEGPEFESKAEENIVTVVDTLAFNLGAAGNIDKLLELKNNKNLGLPERATENIDEYIDAARFSPLGKEQGLGQTTPELSDQDKLDLIDTLRDSEDYYGLAALWEDTDNYYGNEKIDDAILKAMEDLKDGYITRKNAAQRDLDDNLEAALKDATESVAEAKLNAEADFRTGAIDQQERDNYIEDLDGDLQEFEEYLGATYSRDFSNSTGVLDNAIDMRDSAIQEYDAWEASEPNDLSDVTPGENYANVPPSKTERGLGQEVDSTEEAPSVDLSNYEKKDTIFDRLIPGDLIPEYYPIRGTEDWLLRNRAEDPNFEMAPRDEIIARYRTNNPKKVGFKVRDLETGKERYFEVTRASRIYDIYRLPLKAQEKGLGQAAPSTKMAEDATDAQYNYVSSMLNGKEVPEELATAAKQAIEDRNLSKAQVGEIIGKMRDLPNKEGFDPNAPTERMVESVKRNVVAKGLSKEDQDAILAELPNMDKATMSELIGRLKAMDDVNAPEAGLSQSADRGPLYDSNEISNLQDRINKLKGEQGISQFIGDDEYTSVDPESVSDALILAADLNAVSYRMEPTTPEGKALEADLKKASEDIIKSVEEKLGPVEAAKYEIADGSTNKFDSIFDEVDDFMSYYYPSDTDAIYEDLSNGGSVGDVRGGGWEGSVRQNEDGSWLGSVGSPGRDSDSYSETFETSEDAASWVAGSLEQENKYLPDFDVRLFADGSRGGLEDLIEEYGDDPEVLSNKLAGVVNWFRGTNRGMGENIARDLSDYLDRLNEIIASQKKSDEQGLGQESPKA